jgi:hypothetical protein
LFIQTQIYAHIDAVVANLVSLRGENSTSFPDYAIEFTTDQLEVLANDESFRNEITDYIREINKQYPEVHIKL